MLKSLLLNSSSNVGLFVLKLIVAFFLTPVIVHALGNHDYGINEMVLALIGYMGLLEIGLQPAVTRFVARYSASGTREDRLRVYSSAVAFAMVIGSLFALILCAWALMGAPGLVPEEASEKRYILFLSIIAGQVLVSVPGHVFLCIHQGHQRYSLPNSIAAINTIIGSVVVFIFLKYHGYGLVFLTLANSIGVAIKFSLLAGLLHLERYGGYRFRLEYMEMKTLRELLVFGGKSFFLGISSSFSKRAAPILIGALINPAMVAFYILPYNLIGYLANLVSAATLNFMPYFSELHALRNVKKTRNVFMLSSRYVAGLSAFGFVSAAFLGPAFLGQWIGEEYAAKGATVLYCAALWAFIRGFNPFHGRILTAMNLHGVLAKIRGIEAALFLAAALLATLWLKAGIEGVALSVLIAGLCAEPLVLVLVCRQIETGVLAYLRATLLPVLLPLCSAAGFYLLYIDRFSLASYSSIFVAASFGTLLYLVLFFLFSLNPHDRSTILGLFRKAGGAGGGR